MDRYDLLEFWQEWRTSIILFPICAYFLIKYGSYTFLDAADLVIHEAGHLFFAPFGAFIRSAGGTLMQMLVPLMLVWFFYYNQYRTGVQVSLFWFGQNLLNIAVYAADARAQRLPLVGPGPGKPGHDWNYMLGELGMLQYDVTVSYVFVGLAIITFIALLILPKFYY